MNRLDANGVSDEEARCGKRDLPAEEYDELNAHSSDAVGDYLLVRDIFAQGGCFPVQYDIVPYRADLFLEITLSHFNTPSGLRRGGKTRLQTVVLAPRRQKHRKASTIYIKAFIIIAKLLISCNSNCELKCNLLENHSKKLQNLIIISVMSHFC